MCDSMWKEVILMQSAFENARDYVEVLLNVPARLVENSKSALQSCLAELLPLYQTEAFSVEALHVASFDEKKVYLLKDQFHVCFIIVKCPGEKLAVFGPYIHTSPDSAFCQQAMDENHISATQLASLSLFYNRLPVCRHSALISAARIFISHLYGETRREFEVVEIAYAKKQTFVAEENSSNMRQLEQRYELENAFLMEVENGNSEEAIRIYRRLQSEVSNLKRASDPVRNRKNLTIILNTLLRKCVERAKVHPFHIDTISTNFAHFIEHANSIAQLNELEFKMTETYVRLIQRYTLREYSPIVRKAMNYIIINLSSELRLSDIARASGVSPNYLSALFNQETGDSVSAYINQKRISKAAELLENRSTQIQEIAFYVGFSDLNYFTRVFRTIKGMPPGEYRKKCIEKQYTVGRDDLGTL